MNKKIFKQAVFLPLFIILGVISLQIPVSKIIGSSQSFTSFEFFGPITGKFLGPILGPLSVLVVKISEMLFTGKAWDWVTILRLLPMPLAAYYFASKSKNRAIIPGVCMLLFWANPEGRQAWYYALYWLIPVFAAFSPKNLAAKSLGSTFTAHAVGSVIFLYAFALPASVWQALMPVVALERLFFAGGIFLSAVVFEKTLKIITKVTKIKSLAILTSN